MDSLFDGSRRRFVQLGLAALVCATATPAFGMSRKSLGTKSIAFHNLHTDERLRIAYWKDGTYDPSALQKIDYVLRDHRSGLIRPMSPRLIDLLHDLSEKLEPEAPLEIISGYRSPKTNAMMAKASHGVAQHSYHPKGMAADIRLSGTSLSKLHRTALLMQRGGVGYYPSDNFVHVDVGPVRRWG